MENRLELRPIHADIGDNLLTLRGRCNAAHRTTNGPPPERRSTISGIPAIYDPNTRMRNLSGGSSGSTASGSSSASLDNHFSDSSNMLFTPDNMSAVSQFPAPSTVPPSRSSSSSSHRKFDRSLSDSDSDPLGPNSSSSSQRSVNSSRYKTELCRPFEESGSCKYGDKCQFAHGMHELRNLARHPKYKTEPCRTFHTSGFCPYGPRCHFIHADDGKVESSPKISRQTRSSSYSGNSSSNTPGQSSSSGSSSPSLSPLGSDNDYSIFNYQDNSARQFNSLTVNINNFCRNNNEIQTLERHFNTTLNLNNVKDNVFGGHFSCNGSSNPEDQDIFSQVTMFNSEEVDNFSKPTTIPSLQQSVKLDNFPAFVDTSTYWQSNFWSQRSSLDVQPFPHHHSPTGSMGSDGSSSDCSSSTESLASSGCRDSNPGYLSPLSHWIPSF